MSKILVTILLFVATIAVTGCSKDKDDKKKSDGSSPQVLSISATAISIQSTADSKPIANAKVLIGTAEKKPFEANFFVADANGQFEPPADWTNEQPITIEAPGFVRVTYFAQAPQAQVFKLKPSEGSNIYQLNGITSGYTVTNKDGLVDFGVVIPALSREDIFDFDINTIISNEVDTIKVLGQEVDIPANVSLPEQKESYIFPVTLKKPEYRLNFKSTGTKKVVALRGQFQMKPVVDELRGNQDFASLINYFDIQGGAVKNINVGRSGSTADIDVTAMNFSNQKRMIAPDFDEQDEVAVGAILNKKDTSYFPSDFKNLAAGQSQSLKVASNSVNPLLLTFLKRKDELTKASYTDRVSSSLMPIATSNSPELLPLIENPRILSRHLIQARPPKSPNSITPIATYAVVSSIVQTSTVPTLVTKWEAYAPSWVTQIELPEWPSGGSLPSSDARWGITFLGQSTKVPATSTLGPDLFENVTHATHSSLDY